MPSISAKPTVAGLEDTRMQWYRRRQGGGFATGEKELLLKNRELHNNLDMESYFI